MVDVNGTFPLSTTMTLNQFPNFLFSLTKAFGDDLLLSMIYLDLLTMYRLLDCQIHNIGYHFSFQFYGRAVRNLSSGTL